MVPRLWYVPLKGNKRIQFLKSNVSDLAEWFRVFNVNLEDAGCFL